MRIFIRGGEEDGTALYRDRLAAAAELRETLFDGQDTDCYRLAFGEADDLPALIILPLNASLWAWICAKR